MEVGLFILGLLLGVGLTWYLQERYHRDDYKDRDTSHETRLRQLQDELKQADMALAETKERLVALQLEHKALEERALPLEAELAQAKRAAQQAVELETKQREVARALQEEVAHLKRALAARPAEAPAPAPAEPAPVEVLAAPAEPAAAAAAAASPTASKASGTKRRSSRAKH